MSGSTPHTFPCKHSVFITLGGKLYKSAIGTNSEARMHYDYVS
jgi:hypothetical protein